MARALRDAAVLQMNCRHQWRLLRSLLCKLRFEMIVFNLFLRGRFHTPTVNLTANVGKGEGLKKSQDTALQTVHTKINPADQLVAN